MHELAVCQALIEQVERVARDHEARRVISVVVAIGPLSGIEPKLLEHAYPMAAAGTVAADAQLIVELVPLMVRCRTCHAETEASPNHLVCGACHDWQVQVVSGEEMMLQRVEIELAQAHAPPRRQAYSPALLLARFPAVSPRCMPCPAPHTNPQPSTTKSSSRPRPAERNLLLETTLWMAKVLRPRAPVLPPQLPDRQWSAGPADWSRPALLLKCLCQSFQCRRLPGRQKQFD